VKGNIINLNGYEMISFGYVKPSTWSTPREMNEDEIFSYLKKEIEKVDSMDKTILNLHAPP